MSIRLIDTVSRVYHNVPLEDFENELIGIEYMYAFASNSGKESLERCL